VPSSCGNPQQSLVRTGPWNPRQIAAENVDCKGRRHEHRAHPETPVSMHTLPVRTWAGFTDVAAISFWVVLASCHFASSAGSIQVRLILDVIIA
jgi:hypothetical protein